MKRKLLSLLAGGVVAFTMGNAAAQDVAGPLEKAAAKPTGKPGVTAEQRVLLNEKLALVRQIAAAAGVDRVGESVTAERQRWMLESLYKMPTTKLRAMPLTGSPDVLANEIVRASKANTKLEGPAFGGNATELVYIPLTPCRFIDSRNIGGPLVGTAAFDLDLTGSSYGGSAACDPTAAVGNNANNIGAIAINVAIVSPTGAPGFVGARPFGATTTTALVNWYQAGASVQASNAAVVTTDQSLSNPEIELFGSPTQYIVDIFGLFAAPTATALDCQDVVPYDGSMPHRLHPDIGCAMPAPRRLRSGLSQQDRKRTHRRPDELGSRRCGLRLPQSDCHGIFRVGQCHVLSHPWPIAPT